METGAHACTNCITITEKINQIKSNTTSPSYTKLRETLDEILEVIHGAQPTDDIPDFYSLGDKILVATSFKLKLNTLGRGQLKIGVFFGISNPANRTLKVDPTLASDRTAGAICAATLGLRSAQEIGIIHPW